MESKRNKTKISKTLTWLLRHHAQEEGLFMDGKGNVRVSDILQNPKFKEVSVKEIEEIVNTDVKQRYSLTEKDNVLWIRANQGHSIQLSSPDLELIQDPHKYPIVVHGTFSSKLPKILESGGLSRMNRTHIHFAPTDDSSIVISGMRRKCNVIIYVDIMEAMKDGYEFYKSANQVLLCSGNENGYLPLKYFIKVVQKNKN
ncbi:tRNA 2'-phosphotransferase 1 isoform X2 [Lepeophtheirus salmonis]|uniref:tRNA 2'-phosphotransferase 1 isoform X2 n=1 Tax=Lepeophtheirus salmonis TaxID=72036 RepID=UPI001AEB1D78|nr:tRNA 2'-phosphotransferase 1-like isoform X1 [Lepeophtheirus salmonis]